MNRKAALFIFIFSILIYANSLGGSFIWDDQAFVVHNPYIKSLYNFKYFFTDRRATAVGELSEDVFRPITTLSYAIDYSVWKLNSFGFHLTNVIFHAMNGVLVFILLLLLFDNFLFALTGALIFASHPVQTEVVSWISGRSSVLFMFFYLASFILYIKFYREKKMDLYLLSLACFALAIFSKEMAITLPALLVIYDLYFGSKTALKEKVFRYIPYFALALFYMGLRMTLLNRVGQFEGWVNPYVTFLTMSKVVADYIYLLLWPVKLCAVGYEIPLAYSFTAPGVIVSLAVIAALLVMAPLLYRRLRYLSFSIVVFFVTLIPVLNIIPIKTLKAERFLYLPSLGFVIAASFLITLAVKKMDKPAIKRRMSISILLPALLISVYSIRTVIRNEDWTSEIVIGRAAYEAYPTCAWALNTLGGNYLSRGNYEEAVKYIEKAVMYAEHYDIAHYQLGTCYLKLGRYADALKEFKRVLEITPNSHVEIRNRLGIAYAGLKSYDEAEKQFRIIIKSEPAFTDAYLNLGRIAELEHRFEDAIRNYVRITLYAVDSYTRGIAYMRMGDAYSMDRKYDRAAVYYHKALGEFGPGSEGLCNIAREKLNNLPKNGAEEGS